jgi:hypothetical protein
VLEEIVDTIFLPLAGHGGGAHPKTRHCGITRRLREEAQAGRMG